MIFQWNKILQRNIYDDFEKEKQLESSVVLLQFTSSSRMRYSVKYTLRGFKIISRASARSQNETKRLKG